ncbi:hypothetical protein FKM82_002153 [Ascaphus truei]
MAEKSAWRTQGSSPAPRHPQGQETIRELSKAWETISKTKAALRHIENKLDVAPTSTAVFDIVMDTKKPLTSATRKISRKDGRYLEDSTSYISKSSHPNKSRREKSSRSPLRVTTLESNVKSTSHVGFTEPLASYWEAVSTQPTTSERGAMRPVSSLDVGGQEEREFDSTRSSAVDETSVRYLNDRPAIDALDDRLQGPYRDICGSALLTDHKGVRPHETSQPPPSFSPSSLRLETLKRRQPDSKLEKLKERIRRQWELSGERDVREHFPSSVNYTETITIAKTRKVTSAPPAPVYRGFNPPETKIRTPDGKLWQEEDFHNLSAQLYGALLPPPEVGISSNDKSRLKRTSRTVRKVQRLGGAGGPGSPESKTGKGHIISTSSWRDGQKLVKQILGPAPKLEKESKALSSDRPADKRTLSSDRQMGKRAVSSDRNADKRPVPSERQREKRPISSDKQTDRRGLSTERPMDHQDRVNKSASSSERSESGHHVDKSHRGPTHSTNSVNGNNTKPHVPLDDHMESAEVKKDFLPLEIRGILDDLQLDSGIDVPKQTRSRSHSPTKRKPEKGHVAEEPQISSKRRHYDTEQVRLYILRQQEERKKRQSEERKAQRQAEEQKTKRLRELYQKQKEAFGKARSVSPCQRLQDREAQEPIFNQSLEPNLHQPQETHPRALPGQAWPDPTAQEKQFKPMYQPSGESDKENKGQERPPSASSSSDLSLSEPLQPLLRSDLVDTFCRQTDRLTPRVPLPQSLSQAPGGAGISSKHLTLPKDFESLLNPRKSTTNVIPEAHKMVVQGKPTSNNFRSKLDRIEALKATAVSLSTRIESEAKKLAEGSLTYQSTWSTDPGPQAKNAWKKPDSPPEREGGEDAYSSRIQKMLGTCTSHFSQENLPGANNLYKRLPDEFHPHTATSGGRCEVRGEERPSTQRDGYGRPSEIPNTQYGQDNKTSPSHNSSTSSISEGPLLSEGSLSEGEGVPSRGSPLNPAEALKTKEFCIGETKPFEPIAEFQREADNYQPLPASSIGSQVKGPWEELAKGSPHSVINIFTKSYQLYGKGLDGRLEERSPELQPLYAATSPRDSISYADDFNSSTISEAATDTPTVLQPSVDTSASSVKEELPIMNSGSEVMSPHSSGACSAASSPASSSSQRGNKQRKLMQNSAQLPLEHDQNSSGSEHKGQGSKPAQAMSPGRERSAGSDTDSTMGDLSSRSMASLLSDSGRALRSHHSSAKDTGGRVPTPPGQFTTAVPGPQPSGLGQGSIRFSPAGLQQRMSAELNYLSAMEESMRQLYDVERARGISLAQQETVSLAQILKVHTTFLPEGPGWMLAHHLITSFSWPLQAQQQRHEQNMATLRLQAEQEAQASLRQLEEARQKSAQTQAEMLQRFQKTPETPTPQRAHRIQEDVDRGYLSPASSDPIVTSVIDQQKRQQWPHGSRKKGPHSVSPSSQPTSSSSSFREHPHSSGHDSPPAPSVMDVTLNHSELEESIAEELVSPGRFSLTEDSTPTLEEKGTSSALPVDEEGIEELSFRSLLPSEAHRRGSLERQRSQRHESDEESTPDKELSGPFSSGQDSFWRFTMEMVQQYMQEGEMRSTHQAALLRLRQRALKDKTKAELAWLEHQKRRLRDKGEDDKMPPLRKRQRGLLLRLQQEQAEIKRLQEANKAARRERQLILKQQEEIQRIQNSTLRLQEKLKSAESGQLELPSEGEIQPSSVSSHVPSDAESRSPSPVSVSGSETSSIMQKLRKMHSHMDAKFLTKREQQLVQRRLHAQELLEWKRRLDAEELEIRCIEKQALAAWESQRVKTKSQSTEAEEKVVGEKERSEGSPVPLSPAIHTKSSRSPIPQHVLSESIEPSTIDEHIEEQSGEHSSISEDLVASSPSKESPPRSGKSTGQAESSTGSAKTGRHIPRRPQQLSHSWCEESLSMTHSETVSDQSDIESRIRALKEELKKRKSVVDNLKREQKRRQKERLRAQEAVLLQQLQSYDEFIQKTQAELSGEQGTTPSPKSSPKAAMTIREASIAIPASPHRSDGTPIWKSVNENERLVECSSESYGSFSPERSLSSRREVEAEHILEQSVHASSVPLASREDVPAAHQSSLLSPPFGNQLPSSTHDSPVSSIASEIHEEVLETHSHLSISPPPALCLDLRSPTPEGSPSPHKDQSYSDDFEASAPMKHSVSETPREELEASYTTSPGRDVPSEGPSKDDEEHSECWSGSPHSQGILELNPPLQEPPLYSETTDPLAGFLLGDRVLVSGVQPGTLHFKGETQFAEGVWAGIELDRPEGNNDGAHGGRRYFTCPHQHGIFAPPHKISHLSEEKQSPPHTNRYDSSDGRSAEHKEEIDRCLSPTSVEAHEPKTMEMTPLQSTVSNVPELCSTALEDKFNTHDTQLDIPTETTTPEESKKPHTPLLDRLVKEEHRLPTFNKQAQEVSTVTESVLEVCLTDTISHLRNIRRQREERIRQSNQELRRSSIALLYSKKEEVLNTDTHPQPLPVFDVHGQQDLPKHSAELGPSHSLLTVLGEESDWFGEDFGLRSRRTQQRKLEHFPSAEPTPEPCLLVPHPEPAPEPFQALPQPEPIMTVPHTAPEVEQLVHLAAEELWRWKQQSGDLEEIRTRYTQIGDDEQDLANCAYKEVLFDLTLHIFEEMCSPDPRESQPLWKKPPRVTPSYTRRVKDPRNFQEVKSFLTDEVLSLLNLKKEPNHKTDWQRMIKFGRKKRDRVDHILVQELHEEEAQWVNYDEDELFVKMQLADGIFEALVRDTVHVLQCIQEKKNRPLLV